MLRKALPLLVTVCLTIPAFAADDDILIADFEGETYGSWQVTGQAFGPGPARGTLDRQMEVSGFMGKGLVNSFYKGDDTTGTLTSPPFQIKRRYINFLIGGGMNPGKTCINLLVDGKAVRTATGPNDRPGGSERLAWSNWDVSDLAGRTARIEIVDNRKGGWGHINIDHIVQSSRKLESADLTRKIALDKRYLHLPVKSDADKRWVDIIVDGRIVRDFDIRLTADQPDYWAFLDMSEFQGKTATVKLHDSWGQKPGLLEAITVDSTIKGADDFYKEKLRPQFHFTSRIGWNNDSNGMVFYKGEYHLFYQHNPYDWAWGNMTWGHAVSTDLVHWNELGDAIHPDHLGTIFSGSAVVDFNNSAGFQTSDEKPIVCFYTSAGGRNRASKGQPFTQSIAYSNDRGRTFTKYADNPVIGHIRGGNRDPKVIWHRPTSQWVMVLYIEEHEMAFFTSKDLKNWRMTSRIKCFHECPELFELPVDGDRNNSRWVLYGAAGDYLVGSFDGSKFTPDGEPIKFQYGNCFYASQTFSDIPESDGRRIQIAWAKVATPGMCFNQSMTFPVTLTLRSTPQGPLMFAEPVREIELLHQAEPAVWTGRLNPEDSRTWTPGELVHIIGDFGVADTDELILNLRGTRLTYNVSNKQLSCRDKTAPLEPDRGRIHLEILIDRTIIEIYANHGRIYMPIGGILPADNTTIELSAAGGAIEVDPIRLHRLKSAWTGK